MKILIACDALSSANRMYYDLQRSGLSETADVCIISVANAFVLLSATPADTIYPSYIREEINNSRIIANNIRKRLKNGFPKWRFSAESAVGSPAGEILKKAQEWKPDLVVVGAHGRVGVGKFFFGSVALKVLVGCPSSVRIVRDGIEEVESPARIVVGVDGSPESAAAVDWIAARRWRKGSAVHLVTALDSVISTVGLFNKSSIQKEWRSKSNQEPTAWIKKMQEAYGVKLQNAGLIVSSLTVKGDPQEILIREAKRWGAESIFVGSRGHNAFERLLIGSVSTAIATRAHCSVEVVRGLK